MARSTSAKTIRRKLEATPYEHTNETINRLMDDDDTIWIVQGSFGRVPILAESEEEAKDKYVEKYSEEIKREEENVLE